MTARPLALVLATAASALLLSACSGSGDTPAASPSAVPTAQASAAMDAAAIAAACGEITRMTREDIDGLLDRDPADWARFAISLQAVADGSGNATFRDAATAMATAALGASEALEAGTPLGQALPAFEDAVPAVDSLCKKVGAPLN